MNTPGATLGECRDAGCASRVPAHPPFCCAYGPELSGSSNHTSAPPPGASSAPTRPPRECTVRATVPRPMPWPSTPESTRLNRVKTSIRRSAGIPMPLSVTETRHPYGTGNGRDRHTRAYAGVGELHGVGEQVLQDGVHLVRIRMHDRQPTNIERGARQLEEPAQRRVRAGLPACRGRPRRASGRRREGRWPGADRASAASGQRPLWCVRAEPPTAGPGCSPSSSSSSSRPATMGAQRNPHVVAQLGGHVNNRVSFAEAH